MMLLRPVELAFARFQKTRDAKALAIVFDRTCNELLRVARHLADNATAAEDLVQATFLTAIEAAGSHERGKPVLPWLLGILGNHARAAARAARRQPDLQRLRGDVIADVHSEIDARDVRSELAAAIGKLPDVYRPVLRLWFEHGLDAHEIAAVLERPAGTVRAQLSRGMEALRRLLPASLAGGAAITALAGNGLAAVRARVLSHGVATSGLASSLAIGGLLVLNAKFLAAGAAAALALVLWFAASPPAPPSVADAGERSVPAIATAPVAPPVSAVPDRVDAAAAAPAARDETPPASARTRLVVHVRAANGGAPLRDIGVAAEPRDHTGHEAAFVRSDGEGAVRFDALEPGVFVILVDRLGRRGEAFVAAGKTTEHVLEIPAGIAVDGVVLDANGQPAGGARIVAHGMPSSSPVVATADAAGRFRAEHLPASGTELQARSSGHAPSLAHRIVGDPGKTVAMTLQLAAGGRRITGRVLDAAGELAASAAIALLPSSATGADAFASGEPQPRAAWHHTDRDGRFVSDEVAPAKYAIAVIFPEPGVAPVLGEADAREHDADVELRGDAPAGIEGSVRREGAGLPRLHVMAFTERCVVPIGYLQNVLAHCMATTGRDGSFRIPSLLPGEVVLRVFKGTEVLAEKRVRAVAGETARCDLEVGRTNALVIRVTSAAPLPGELRAWVYPRGTAEVVPSAVAIDARGNGRFEAPRASAVDIVLAAMPGSTSWIGIARIENVAADRNEVLFELAAEQLPVHCLRGRLVDGVAAPISGATVRAQRTDGPQALIVMVEAMTDANGAFALGPLPAGRYTLTSGSLAAQRPLGDALLTNARDEQLGDLVLPAAPARR